jgi:putative ABC transport system ATP-binding protein
VLNLVAGLDRPSSGRLVVAGTDLGRLSESELARWRSLNVGVIFQFDTLIPFLTALENVELPLRLLPLARKQRSAHALQALELVGLSGRSDHSVRHLCGDETQRLAIARAIVTDPKVLVADEPTRRLDPCSADRVLTLLQKLSRERGKTLLLATRDPQVAARADARHRLQEGGPTRRR